jgi:hypothetical protein
MESGPANRTMHVAALQHFEAGRFAEAATLCGAILNSTPRDHLALRLLGLVRSKQGAFDQAVRCLSAALAAAPLDNVEAVTVLNVLADALLAQQDSADALNCYRRALALFPNDVGTLQNFGNALVGLNRRAEALEQYRAALTVAPDSAQLRFNVGVSMLSLGMWPEAWEPYEARLSIPHLHVTDQFPSGVPHWRGESDISNKTILLHAEQGLGDTLQCVRYVPLVARRAAHVVLRVQPALRKLLVGLPGADTVITFHDDIPHVDAQCPLMSLPLAFSTRVTDVPCNVPYLRASPEYLMLWQALLGPRRRKRIGIVCSSSQRPPRRSVPLATLASLLARQDLEFHVLQPEIQEADRVWLAAHTFVVDHSAQLKDFADTAALASQMDLVLSVDTSMVHLAGALGVPVWVMLPFSAEWRWLLDRTDTPWYPTVRLFRQKRADDWDGLVAEVAQALSV